MRKFLKLIVFCIIMSFLMCTLCSCYDAMDINKKHIVTAVILDYKDQKVQFNVEIADIEGSDSDSGEDKYKYVTGVGTTIMESRQQLDRNLDRQLYLSAIRAIIFTEDFINEYLIEYLNRLRASEQYNKKVIIVTTSCEPSELIETCKENKMSVGFSTEEMLTTLKKQGESFSRTTQEVIEKLSNDHAAMLLPCIGVKDKTNTLLGYTVIDKNKVKGFIDAQKANGAVLFNREKAESQYLVEYNGQDLSVEGKIKHCKIKPLYSDGKIKFKVDCQMKATLLYGDSRPPYTFSRSDYEKIERMLKQDVKKQIEQTVKKAQTEHGCDYLYFDDAFRIKYPKVFDTLDWTKEFKTANVDVDVKIDLDSIWLMDYEEKN